MIKLLKKVSSSPLILDGEDTSDFALNPTISWVLPDGYMKCKGASIPCVDDTGKVLFHAEKVEDVYQVLVGQCGEVCRAWVDGEPSFEPAQIFSYASIDAAQEMYEDTQDPESGFFE